jgi:uncharacterized delta-60 repeat protein
MTRVHLGTQIHLDTRFGNGGFAIATPSAVDGLEFADVGLVQVTGGRLIAGGTGVSGQTEHFYLAGYDSDGRVDRGFGQNGDTASAIAASGSALTLQPATKPPLPQERDGAEMVLIGGQAGDPATGNNVFAVQRYTLNGNLDTRFATDGTALVDVAPVSGPADSDDESVTALAVQPRLGILAAGWVSKPNGSRGAIVRLHFDGRLDTTFNGRQGRLIFPALDAPGDLWGQVPNTAFVCLAMQENGRILVGGNYGAQFLVARLTADGSFDPSFGQGGLVLLTLGLGYVSGQTLLVQPDGRIVLVATVGSPTATGLDSDVTAIVVARLLPNGDLDPTFGQLIPGSYGQPANRYGGVRHRVGWGIENVPGTGFEGVNDAVLETGAHEGIIAVGGTRSSDAFQGDLLVTRFLGDGDVDTLSTGPAGAVESPVPEGGGAATAAVYDPDAHALTVAGGVSRGDRMCIGLARYRLPE